KKRNSWITGISLLVLLIGGVFLIYYRNTRRKLHIMQQQEEINALKAMHQGEEQERNRIAQELHDGIGSLLSAASINLNTMADTCPQVRQNTFFRKTKTLMVEVNTEVRKTAYNLMPHTLLQYNLPDAIRLFCSYMIRT